MRAFRRLVLTALLAGLLCGPTVSAVRALWVTPLIVEAERYEASAQAVDPSAAHAQHLHESIAQKDDSIAQEDDIRPLDPQAGLGGPTVTRLAYSVLADTLLAIGCALLLVAAMTVSGRAGWRVGLGFGLAGYVVMVLAPSLGLPPELPGSVAAPLAERQLWWILTALTTAFGLGCLLLGRWPALVVLGALLIVTPHLMGAPRPELAGDAAPAALAQRFQTMVLVTGFLFWCLLGAASGAFLARAAVPAAPKRLPADAV